MLYILQLRNQPQVHPGLSATPALNPAMKNLVRNRCVMLWMLLLFLTLDWIVPNYNVCATSTAKPPSFDKVPRNESSTNYLEAYVEQSSQVLFLELGNEIYQKCYNAANPDKISISAAMERPATAEAINLKFEMCILSEKWDKDLKDLFVNFQSISPPKKSRRTFIEDYDNMFWFDREIDPSWSRWQDCLSKHRRKVRHVPTNCYWVDELKYKKDETINMLTQIGPDILYAFDFVLQEKNIEESLENKFWYLMAYLKVVATLIPNPYRLVELIHNMKALNVQLVFEVGRMVLLLKNLLVTQLEVSKNIQKPIKVSNARSSRTSYANKSLLSIY